MADLTYLKVNFNSLLLQVHAIFYLDLYVSHSSKVQSLYMAINCKSLTGIVPKNWISNLSDLTDFLFVKSRILHLSLEVVNHKNYNFFPLIWWQIITFWFKPFKSTNLLLTIRFLHPYQLWIRPICVHVSSVRERYYPFVST